MTEKKTTPISVLELTDDEARKIEESMKATFTEGESVWNKIDPHALLKELDSCQDRLPPLLFTALREMLMKHLVMSPGRVWGRWAVVRALRDSGLTWDETYREASRLSEGTLHPASKETMRQDYMACEKRLPPKLRRPRTYRRHQTQN